MNDPVMQETSSPGSQKDSPKRPAERRGSVLGYTAVALGLALFIRFFVAAPYVVSGASMEPNFDNWHYLIVDRITYDLEPPMRGDVIVFDLPEDPSRSLIKRVIGLPGETVILKEDNVTIINQKHPEGFTLEEPYLNAANLGGSNSMRVTLDKDQYFVLGDNRRVSADSRLWGTLPKHMIVGRAIIRLYPFDKISVLPGEARYEE